MRSRLLLPGLLVLGCAFVAFTGCQTAPYVPAGSTGAAGGEALADVPPVESVFPPAAAARFDDIPIPEGLKMVHERSFVFESGDLQIAFLIYEGRMAPEDAAQFFVDTLPRAGWTLHDVLEYNDITIKFDQPDRNLLVHVSPRMIKGCVTKIMLTPKSK